MSLSKTILLFTQDSTLSRMIHHALKCTKHAPLAYKLQQMEVNEMVKTFPLKLLKTGTTFSKSQSSGIEFVVIDCVKITCSIGTISNAYDFKNDCWNSNRYRGFVNIQAL